MHGLGVVCDYYRLKWLILYLFFVNLLSLYLELLLFFKNNVRAGVEVQ